MSGPRIAWLIFAKDLVLDFRTRDRLGHMAVFAALVVTLLSVVLPSDSPQRAAIVPALFWVVMLFASLLGLARSFQAESEGGALVQLALVPVDRGWVFVGKAAANSVALLGVALVTALLFSVFFGVDWLAGGGRVLGVLAAGVFGLAPLGTLLSALSLAARFREFLLPVLLFPLVLPVLVFATWLTAAALRADEIEAVSWAQLALYDWVFALIGYFVFDFALED